MAARLTRRKRWRALRAGDCVDVVAPGSRCPRDIMERGLQVLRDWGLRPRVPADLFGDTVFAANTQAHRWRHLLRALRAPDSAAVWCVRGGYGAIHLAVKIAATPAPSVAKPLIGFSDVSALTHAVNAAWGWDAVHGPVISQLGNASLAAADIDATRKLLFGRAGPASFGTLRALNERARIDARASLHGRLSAGNLATLQSLCGSVMQPLFSGRIVVLEEVNERGYEIDRMLFSLLASGAFKGARAVVFGEFVRCEEADGRSLVADALADFAARARLPVFAGLPAGHGARLPPLVEGAPATITSGARGRYRMSVALNRP